VKSGFIRDLSCATTARAVCARRRARRKFAAGQRHEAPIGSTSVREGLVGAYAPVLPPTWKSMTLKNVAFRGHRYDITIDRGSDGKPRLMRRPLANEQR